MITLYSTLRKQAKAKKKYHQPVKKGTYIEEKRRFWIANCKAWSTSQMILSTRKAWWKRDGKKGSKHTHVRTYACISKNEGEGNEARTRQEEDDSVNCNEDEIECEIELL